MFIYLCIYGYRKTKVISNWDSVLLLDLVIHSYLLHCACSTITTALCILGVILYINFVYPYLTENIYHVIKHALPYEPYMCSTWKSKGRV